MKMPGGDYLAHVEEGLGTKNLVADAEFTIAGYNFYDHVSQCSVAMVVNDLITCGARPLSYEMHLAVGSTDWFKEIDRAKAIIRGCKHACDLAQCSWGGGETPTLRDLVNPESFVLSGSATGYISNRNQLINPANIRAGDQIILIRSSGCHANGYTMIRKIADELPDGYSTKLSDDTFFGPEALRPTIIYARLVEEILKAGIKVHYAVNITGHGWRKLMRATKPFGYVIDNIPTPQPIFAFIQEHGPVDIREMYGNFNMGAGFALYVAARNVKRVLKIANEFGYDALHAGRIVKRTPKEVVIKPLDIIFRADELAIR